MMNQTKNKKYLFAIILLTFGMTVSMLGFSDLFACSDHEDPQSKTENWLSYEPTEIALQGKLKSVEKYGAPNYGESPQTDKKVKILLLKLKTPIQVKGDPQSASNQESFTDIKEIQVLCSDKAQQCQELQDKNVSVTGSLFQAVSGHHYTKVILNLKSIQAS
ncbi:MAG: DUF4431 domain-containing protein [Deltaproteobacteria bacterium]|nr:DUF4431 domain-containing protein [Deltaproteobacteria bacterium]